MGRRRIGLTGRLFTAQALVVLTGTTTLGLVAASVGPVIFHDHLRRVEEEVSPETLHHVEEAYTSASALSSVTGLFAALFAALAVSALVARRVARPVTQLAHATARVADGDYTIRVAEPGLGEEFDTLVSAFHTMALRLRDVEATRRRLLADLGHEMRTPLATIEAYLEAAEDGLAVDDEDTLSVLRTQTTRLRRLSEDISAISRAEEHQFDLHLVPVAPADLVDSAVVAIRPRYEAKGVRLEVQVVGEVPDITADPVRLGQVLSNLLDNALRHTPSGQGVGVTVTAEPPWVRITVADTGEGIAAEHLPHVFERFYRADAARDRDHGGSGIGLAIVRALVQAHRGQVSANSPGPGRGTTLTVTLPVVPGRHGVDDGSAGPGGVPTTLGVSR
jgi:signal transduction histidine kinase